MSLIINPAFPPDSQSPRLGAQDIRSITATILSLFGFTGLTSETIADPPGPQVDTNTGYFLIPSMPGPRNLRIVPDVSNPTTTMDVTADFVYMLNLTTFTTVSASSFAGNCVIVGSQSGSKPNGRDQAAAFTSSTFFHLYAIGGGGQSPVTLASATPPPTGPTLPTSYTSWAYLGSYLLNSANVYPSYTLGNTVYFQSPFASFSGLTSTTSAAIPTSYVPAIATSYTVNFNIRANSNGTVSGTAAQFCVSPISPANANAYAVITVTSAGVGSPVDGVNALLEIPNIATSFYYVWILNGLSSPNGNGTIISYKVPNGA